MDKKTILDVANANEPRMDGTTAPVLQILAENDIVFAVWKDPRAEDGVSTLLLKGERRLGAIASETEPVPQGAVRLKTGPQALRWSAVKVLNREMALAAKQTLGEH